MTKTTYAESSTGARIFLNLADRQEKILMNAPATFSDSVYVTGHPTDIETLSKHLICTKTQYMCSNPKLKSYGKILRPSNGMVNRFHQQLITYFVVADTNKVVCLLPKNYQLADKDGLLNDDALLEESYTDFPVGSKIVFRDGASTTGTIIETDNADAVRRLGFVPILIKWRCGTPLVHYHNVTDYHGFEVLSDETDQSLDDAIQEPEQNTQEESVKEKDLYIVVVSDGTGLSSPSPPTSRSELDARLEQAQWMVSHPMHQYESPTIRVYKLTEVPLKEKTILSIDD